MNKTCAIIDPNTGRPAVVKNDIRHDEKFDASRLPKGVETSWAKHEEFIRMLENNHTLRENLEKADRQLGTKSICLMRFDNRYSAVVRTIDNALKKAEDWMRQRKEQKFNKDDNHVALEALKESQRKAISLIS